VVGGRSGGRRSGLSSPEFAAVWQLTSEQDWEICERQQRGINSSAYRPGPYSPYKEYNVDGFVRWYLKSLGVKKIEQPRADLEIRTAGK